VKRTEGKKSLGRPKGRWDDSVKMNLQEGGWRSMDWIDLAHDRDWLGRF
jgi:hypothetical protein